MSRFQNMTPGKSFYQKRKITAVKRHKYNSNADLTV